MYFNSATPDLSIIFYILAFSMPLGLWKMAEIIYWVATHIHFG